MTLLHPSRALRVALPCLLLGLSRTSSAETLVAIDVPSAMETFPAFVNAYGEIVGQYRDSTGSLHAFVRFPGGTFLTIDVASDPTGQVTFPNAINWAGQIVGVAGAHGFVRDPIGRITMLDVPGASRTVPSAINAEGWIAGTFQMPSSPEAQGFLYRPGRPLVTFDFPGLFNVVGIDATGRIFGALREDIGVAKFHEYVRTLDGGFTTTDPPDVGDYPIGCFFCRGTLPSRINALGRSVGIYGGSTAVHGYVRTAGGTFITIEPPGAVYAHPNAINLQGQVVGYYSANDSTHPFVMQPNGSFRTFDVFGSTSVAATDINVQGEVVGSYADADFKIHGFLYRM